MGSFKKEIAEILGHKFGEATRKMILDQYSDDNPQELYELANHMLSAFMGKKNTDAVLDNLVKKYKVRLKK